MVSTSGGGNAPKKAPIGAIPAEVLVNRLRSRESVPLTTNSSRCSERFQEFLSLVMLDLESSDTRQPDVEKEQQVRLAAEMAIKEIRLYGFELRKAVAIETTSERDIGEYRKQRDQIEESIQEVQAEIGTLKEELVVERKKRYNKEIYEETCKDINNYPPHKATKLGIERLMKELSAADEKKQAAQAVQRLKQKQIALIMQSVADVQATVDEGDGDTGPTAGALELVHPDEEGDMGVGDEDGDGDGDDRDDDNNGQDEDGEEEEENRRRSSRRKREGSDDGNDSDGEARARIAGGLENGEVPPSDAAGPRAAVGGAAGDVDMPDAA